MALIKTTGGWTCSRCGTFVGVNVSHTCGTTRDTPEWGFYPVIDAGGGWVKHIVKEGARYHVIAWSSLGRQCSEPRCEINRPEPKP